MSVCASQLQHMKAVPDISTLKSLALDFEEMVFLPKKGNYVWYENSSRTPDDVLVLRSDRKPSGNGRWELKVDTVVDVRWFDPVAFGGSIPDVIACQMAVDAASRGMTIYFPCAIYTFNSSTLKITKDAIRLLGDGQETVFYHSGTGSVVESSTKDTAVRTRVIFEGIKFQSNTTTQSNPVVNMKFFQRSTMRDCWVIGNLNGGVYGNSLAINVEGDWGVVDATYNQFHNVYIGGVFHGILFNHNANSCKVTNGCRFQHIGGFGVWMNDVNHIVITFNEFEFPGNVSTGVFAAGNVDTPIVTGNRFESMDIGIYFELGVITGYSLPNYFSSCVQNIKNNSLNSTVLQDGILTLRDLVIGPDNTEGFSVNQSIIAPYLNPADVFAEHDKFFFNSVDSAFDFRSLRGDTGLQLWNYSSAAFHRIWYVDSTASTKGGNGSAALPAFSFAGDPDTGMYYAGTDNLGFSAGGVKVMGISQSKFSITIGALPVHANNAAAITGGLVAGDVYRTGLDPDHICIVH